MIGQTCWAFSTRDQCRACAELLRQALEEYHASTSPDSKSVIGIATASNRLRERQKAAFDSCEGVRSGQVVAYQMDDKETPDFWILVRFPDGSLRSYFEELVLIPNYILGRE